MPRYEYECENGHCTLYFRKFTQYVPTNMNCSEIVPMPENSVIRKSRPEIVKYLEDNLPLECGAWAKRIYSTFSFRMA